MKFNSSSKIFSWYYFIIIIVILALGAGATVFTYIKISKSMQDTLLKDSASIGSMVEPSDIAALYGDESDIANPAYISLKYKLEKVPKINDEIRFVYLWGYRDGNVYFMVDSEPATSPDYSPPGEIYHESTDIGHAMFVEGLPSVIEMNTDRWGTWISALTPIIDPNTGKLSAVLGIDMNANRYNRTVLTYTAIPGVTTIFILSLFVIGFLLRKREEEFISFKSELVSIASHEIRSPLTGIDWLADGILHAKSSMTDKEKESIRIIKNKSEGLLSTINDLLDVATAEKISKRRLEKKPILVKQLFDEILNESLLNLAEKNLKLILDASISAELVLQGDRERIKRMFNNLVSNAIKYSKEGGAVSIGLTTTKETFVFWIKDTGIGISEKDVNKIFKGFFRTENAKILTKNGTGLGLHYVRQIAELHSGKVWCKSTEGTGSTFYVELPRG